jgi:hypothetical protein
MSEDTMDPTTNPHHGGAPGAQRFGRAPVEAADLDPSRRPGVPRERPPQPWPNSRFPPQRMTAEPSAPMHGRPNKQLPPVYGTAVPPRGVSGLIRQAAYRYPDHVPIHWLLLLFADRVDSWGTRTWRTLKVVTPLAAVAFVGARALGLARR